MEWHTDTTPKLTLKALTLLSKEEWLSRDGWYLAGGTALALQVGHRQSVDLDFFTERKNFLPLEVTKNLSDDVWKADIVQEGTIYGKVLGAKVSFIAYPFFAPMTTKISYGKINVLHKDDIAVMKIIALSQRGRKRDFLDLYWYAKNVEPLDLVIKKLPRQYPTVAHNYHHIIKSLTYFDDAEKDVMPTLFFNVTWKEVKSYFQKEVPRIAKKLMGLD